jgi:hypothetical protein
VQTNELSVSAPFVNIEEIWLGKVCSIYGDGELSVIIFMEGPAKAKINILRRDRNSIAVVYYDGQAYVS